MKILLRGAAQLLFFIAALSFFRGTSDQHLQQDGKSAC